MVLRLFHGGVDVRVPDAGCRTPMARGMSCSMAGTSAHLRRSGLLCNVACRGDGRRPVPGSLFLPGGNNVTQLLAGRSRPARLPLLSGRGIERDRCSACVPGGHGRSRKVVKAGGTPALPGGRRPGIRAAPATGLPNPAWPERDAGWGSPWERGRPARKRAEGPPDDKAGGTHAFPGEPFLERMDSRPRFREDMLARE